MRVPSFKLTFITPLLLIGSVYSSIGHTLFSAEVSRAMDQANICVQAQQISVYSECMQNNNRQLNQAITNITKHQTSRSNSTTSQTTIQNINKKIKASNKRCFHEKNKFVDNMLAERRYYYCIYENLLELLINLEQRPEIYQ